MIGGTLASQGIKTGVLVTKSVQPLWQVLLYMLLPQLPLAIIGAEHLISAVGLAKAASNMQVKTKQNKTKLLIVKKECLLNESMLRMFALFGSDRETIIALFINHVQF